MKVKAQFPEKLGFLFQAARYKTARGGRGSGKSWGFARALLIMGARYKLRILCAREVQDSIKASVHKLLKDQIELLGFGAIYDVLETSIRGYNGTEFIFTGLSNLTIESIKSIEAIDICWVEEGQNISDRSWVILIPTIRKDNSEIWISFNPDLETDPTYERFIINSPPGTVSAELNWRDNPWFSDLMNQERLHCKATDPFGYENIWEGKCRPAVEGAIYAKEIALAESENRICNIPYDPTLKVHVVMDLGWADSLGVALVQKHLSEIRIIKYLEYTKTKLDIMSAELKALRLNWGLMWLPHDGFSGQLNSGGKSTYDIMNKLGWDLAVKEAKKKTDIEIVQLGIEDGIRNARLKFNQMYFDANNVCGKVNPFPAEGHTLLTGRLLECLKRYRRKINKQTQSETTPMHDEFSHGSDCFRYIAANADNMRNEAIKLKRVITYPGYKPFDAAVGY